MYRDTLFASQTVDLTYNWQGCQMESNNLCQKEALKVCQYVRYKQSYIVGPYRQSDKMAV